MRSSSIRVNLLAWLIIPGLLVLGIGARLSYEQAFRLSNIVTDQQLTASARMIAEQVAYSDDSLVVTIPPAALELFASESHDEVAYAVTDPAGTLIAGYPGLDTPAIAGRGNLLFFETTFRDEEPMRAVDFLQTVVTPTGGVTVRVSVGETLKARDALVTTLWMRGFLEQGALVIAGAISIWFGISRELAPLLRLRQEVRDRRPDQFEPFDADKVQTEIRPLVQALNAHMDRLRQQLERQRRFLDSAAHQLRTPLAVIKTQVNYALRARERSEANLALTEVDSNLTSMARMTSQLLALGGVDHNRTALQSETLDLSEIAHQVVLEAASRALDAGIEMAFDSDGPAEVVGSDVMLVELVTNLVDNVIAHAGSGAEATIAVRKGVRDVILRVEDSGAGAADEDRPGLLQRFRRGKNARPGGSGLGLSIVSEIVESMGGTIELPAPRAGRGFAVEVRLPVLL
jgi:two-component system sensor histidine kinase TctE